MQAGDHVGVLAINMPEVIESLFAIALADGVAVLLNARYKTSELAFVIENADIKWLFTTRHFTEHQNFPELLCRTLPGLEHCRAAVGAALDAAPLLRSVVCSKRKPCPA